MKVSKFLFAFMGFGMISLAIPAQASAGDELRCTADITYEGQTVQVKESVRSEEHAKRALPEEGCDKLCDKLPTKEERKDCEHKCDVSAEMKNLTCGKKPQKSKAEEEKDDAEKLRCTGDVTYDGKTYSVKKKAKTEKKSKKKLIEKACLKPCTGFFGSVDEACMAKCEKQAELKNLKCEPPKGK